MSGNWVRFGEFCCHLASLNHLIAGHLALHQSDSEMKWFVIEPRQLKLPLPLNVISPLYLTVPTGQNVCTNVLGMESFHSIHNIVYLSVVQA